MTTIDLTAAIEAGAWALIDSDTDVVDRGVSEDHYGQRLDDAKIALTAALPHIEQQLLIKWQRPQYCCGKCPPVSGGGYDCTCRGNERCTQQYVKPSRDEIAQAVGSAATPTQVGFGVVGIEKAADAILALLPGKSEREVKAEGLREAHARIRKSDMALPGMTAGDALRFLMNIADDIERGEGL